jgi:hypothetical protein
MIVGGAQSHPLEFAGVRNSPDTVDKNGSKLCLMESKSEARPSSLSASSVEPFICWENLKGKGGHAIKTVNLGSNLN